MWHSSYYKRVISSHQTKHLWKETGAFLLRRLLYIPLSLSLQPAESFCASDLTVTGIPYYAVTTAIEGWESSEFVRRPSPFWSRTTPTPPMTCPLSWWSWWRVGHVGCQISRPLLEDFPLVFISLDRTLGLSSICLSNWSQSKILNILFWML